MSNKKCSICKKKKQDIIKTTVMYDGNICVSGRICDECSKFNNLNFVLNNRMLERKAIRRRNRKIFTSKKRR